MGLISMETLLPLTVETGEPMSAIHCRTAAIKLDGVTLLSEVVYDTDHTGSRSHDGAAANITRLFADRLRKLVSD